LECLVWGWCCGRLWVTSMVLTAVACIEVGDSPEGVTPGDMCSGDSGSKRSRYRSDWRNRWYASASKRDWTFLWAGSKILMSAQDNEDWIIWRTSVSTLICSVEGEKRVKGEKEIASLD
jgi:hypothetical protein